jgi:hypothetical protein
MRDLLKPSKLKLLLGLLALPVALVPVILSTYWIAPLFMWCASVCWGWAGACVLMALTAVIAYGLGCLFTLYFHHRQVKRDKHATLKTACIVIPIFLIPILYFIVNVLWGYLGLQDAYFRYTHPPLSAPPKDASGHLLPSRPTDSQMITLRGSIYNAWRFQAEDGWFYNVTIEGNYPINLGPPLPAGAFAKEVLFTGLFYPHFPVISKDLLIMPGLFR